MPCVHRHGNSCGVIKDIEKANATNGIMFMCVCVSVVGSGLVTVHLVYTNMCVVFGTVTESCFGRGTLSIGILVCCQQVLDRQLLHLSTTS